MQLQLEADELRALLARIEAQKQCLEQEKGGVEAAFTLFQEQTQVGEEGRATGARVSDACT